MMHNAEPPPKKGRTWIWILVMVLLCLCCVVLIMLAGGLYYLQQNGMLDFTMPELNLPGPETAPTEIAVPTQLPAATEPPAATVEYFPLVVEPFDPAQGQYNFMSELAVGIPGDHAVPGTNEWQVTVRRDQPVILYRGWCTTTEAVLGQNLENMQWEFEVDDRVVPLEEFYIVRVSSADQACLAYSGIIWEWSQADTRMGVDHVIVSVMSIRASINDGWGDYPPGDYINLFNITVIP